ncbi:hypothetical protein BD309DRAFT_262274 [Dichomitus squalens]|nr:hypothetical protein BD309DRAFT_262274 [Dichomitus squalens]
MHPHRSQLPNQGQGRHHSSSGNTRVPGGNNRQQDNLARGGAQSGAVPAQGRGGVVTPVPQLSFSVGQLVWLEHYVNREFRGQHVVQITHVEHQVQSPTARPGQSNEWQRADYDTVYRFKMATVKWEEASLSSPSQVNPVRHDQLSYEKGGQPSHQRYGVNQLVYLRETLNFKVDGARIQIPVRSGTRCCVVSITSRAVRT